MVTMAAASSLLVNIIIIVFLVLISVISVTVASITVISVTAAALLVALAFSIAFLVAVPAHVAAVEAVNHETSKILVGLVYGDPVAILNILSDELAVALAIGTATRVGGLIVVEGIAAVLTAAPLGALLDIADGADLLPVLGLDVELVVARQLELVFTLAELPDLVVGAREGAKLSGTKGDVGVCGDGADLLVSVVPDVGSGVAGVDDGASSSRRVEGQPVALILVAMAMLLAFLQGFRLRKPEVRAPGGVVAVQVVTAAVDAASLAFEGGAGGTRTACATGTSVFFQKDVFGVEGGLEGAAVVARKLLVDIGVVQGFNDRGGIREVMAAIIRRQGVGRRQEEGDRFEMHVQRTQGRLDAELQ